MIKKIFITFLILAAVSSSAYAVDLEGAAPLFFPKVKHLSGGLANWLDTGIHKKKGENYTSFNTSYSYMGDKEEILLNIKRKKSFSVNASVYVFHDFLSAYRFYEKSIEGAPKGRVRNVKFGDIGQFYYVPNSGYINDADFYLTFVAKTFVVKIKADDGFALMDVSHVMNSRIKKYLALNYKTFLIKKLTLAVKADNFLNSEAEHTFVGTNPSELTLSGYVFDKSVKPVAGADVRLLETGETAVTDEKGFYSFNLALGGEKPMELKKSFYLKPKKDRIKNLDTGYYMVRSVYARNGKAQKHIWKLKVFGERILGDSVINIQGEDKTLKLIGTYKDNDVEIRMDCSAITGRNCEQVFKGKVQFGRLSGRWEGTGGGGRWNVVPGAFKIKNFEIPLNKENTEATALVYHEEKFSEIDGKGKLAAGAHAGYRYFFIIKPDVEKLIKDKDAVKSARLTLNRFQSKADGDIYIYVGEYGTDDKGFINSQGGIIFGSYMKKSENPYEVELDVTEYLLDKKYKGVLVGPVLTTEDNGVHMFAGTDFENEKLRPKLIVGRFVQTKNFADEERPIEINMLEEEADLVSRKNSVKKDGKNDIALEMIARLKGKTINKIEVVSEGEVKFIYNTHPFDIYPAVALVKDGKILNKSNGSVSYKLNKFQETFKLYISKGTIDKENVNLKYKIYTDDGVYEGSVEN